MLRDYTDSFKVNDLSFEAECLFIRLIMKADDFGRYHANPRIVRSTCFPLKIDKLPDESVERMILELEVAGLIYQYVAENGNKYMQINQFDQRLRQKHSKFPEPITKSADNCPQPAVNCPQHADNGRPEEKRREEEEKMKRREDEGNGIEEEPEGTQPLPTPIIDINTYHPNQTVNSRNCKQEQERMLNDQIAVEGYCMKHGCNPEDIRWLLSDFVATNAIEQKEWKSYSDFQKHFSNWLNLSALKKLKDKIQPVKNRKVYR